jgi:hypothetical protein
MSMRGVDLAAIRAALVSAVSNALDGLSVLDFVPGAVNVPCVIFTDDDPLVEMHGSVQGPSGAGLSFVHLRAYVLVSKTIDRGAQIALDELCSFGNGQGRSVPDVIEAAKVAGASQVVVQEISGMRMFSFNDQQGYAGRELSLYVVASRGA